VPLRFDASVVKRNVLPMIGLQVVVFLFAKTPAVTRYIFFFFKLNNKLVLSSYFFRR
jgi:hypothetical protein